nr:MAG TPA: hypothetical protein [Caudoviricetes sp.]
MVDTLQSRQTAFFRPRCGYREHSENVNAHCVRFFDLSFADHGFPCSCRHKSLVLTRLGRCERMPSTREARTSFGDRSPLNRETNHLSFLLSPS